MLQGRWAWLVLLAAVAVGAIGHAVVSGCSPWSSGYDVAYSGGVDVPYSGTGASGAGTADKKLAEGGN